MFKRLSIVSCLLFITVVGFSQKLFIAENGASNIRRSNVDGTSLEIIDGNAFVSAPRSLVYDEQRNNVFWIETNGAFERIKKASLTDFGGNSRLGYASNLVSVSTTGNNFRYLVINPITRELLFSNNGSIVAISLDATGTITALPPARFSSAAFIQGFDIDVTNNKIYFIAQSTSREIRIVNLNGTGVVTTIVPNPGVEQMSDIVVDANGGRFYYSNRTNSSVGQIIARDLTTGANPITVVDNLAATVNGIALDRKNEFLFWADGTSAIGRSSLSGTGKINIVTGLNAPVDVALDFSSSLPPKLYWTEPGINEIHRMNTDGSDFERYFSDFTSTTNGIAIDQTTRYAYWTDETQPLIIKGFINETTFSALDTLVDYGYGYVGFGGVALDPSNHMIYFAYTEGGKIQRADYNLPTPIAVGSIQDLATISNPFGVAVDLVRKKLYYTSNDLSSTNTGTLTRSNLDGTNPEVLITQSISSPQRFMRDVKVDVKNRMVYWALSELDGVATIYKANIADVAGTATPLINNTSGEIRGIEIDFSSDQLWWVSRGISNAAIPPAIKNAKLSDGSGVNTLHTITFSPTANFIALDRGCEQPIASGLSLNALHGESSTVDPVVTSYHHVNDIINVNITQNPTKGVVVVQSDGKISYTPNDGTSGVDVIGYEICNQCGLCDQAIINITIPYVPPVIIPPSGTTSIIVYTGMSPNGDQFNPYFRIENIEIVEPQNKVSIFNRWGDKVFEIENYNNSDPAKRFNGESDKGKDLPTGIYFYKIEFGSGSPELTGYLTIKR